VRVGPASGSGEDIFVVPVQAIAHVEAGHDASVTLRAEPGTAVNIHLLTLHPSSQPTIVRATDAAGSEVLRRSVYWNEPRPGELEREGFVGLVGHPGVYTVTVECEGQVLAEQVITVPAGVNMGPEVRITLP
jgi:hypothetical protein